MSCKAWPAAGAVFLFLTGWMRAGTIASPPAACPAGTGSLESYIALGATGCTIGGFTYWDFQFAADVASTATPIDASAVAVTPAASPTALGIRFSSSGFEVASGQWVVYWLTYNIDPPPVIIRGFEEKLYPYEMAGSQPPIIRGDELALASAIGPGWVTIDTLLCVGGIFTGPAGSRSCSAQSTTALSLFDMPPGSFQYTDSVVFGSLVNTVGVWHTIRLDATAGGTADFWALDNRAFLVPEPAGWLLLGGGLALLALLRRRRAS